MHNFNSLYPPEVPQYPNVQCFETLDGPHYVEDEYAWLIHRDDPAVKAVAEAQNRVTAAYMEADSLAARLTARIDELNNSAELRSVADAQGSTLIWEHRAPGQEQTVIKASGPDGQERVIVDPNTIGEGISLSWYECSPRGDHFVYALQHNGKSDNSIHIRNTETGDEEHFATAKMFSMVWDNDGQGFVYSRSNGAAHGNTKDYTSFQQLCYHRVGTDRADDIVLFDAHQQGLKPNAWLSAEGMDGKYMLSSVWLSKTNIKPYLVDTETGAVQPIAAEDDGAHRTFLRDGYVYNYTTFNADKKQLLRSPIENVDQPLSEWEPILPEDSERPLRMVSFTKDHIVAEYTHNIASELQIHDQTTGAYLKSVPLPPLSSIKEIATADTTNVFHYKVADYLSEGMLYEYDGAETKLIWKDGRSLDPEEYDVVQEQFRSSDGAIIPTTLICQRGLLRHIESSKIVLQDQYAGFANGRYPDQGANNMRRVWLENGGIISLPNNRGGDEFGSHWHTDATGPNKGLSFDDSVNCARYLKETGVATKIGLSGGSNGGLVVLAAMLRAPDVIDAVDARVPLTDMYNYLRYSPAAQYWKGEYGDAQKPNEFPWLAAYSPYHHIDESATYRVLLTAGMNDQLVDPIHSMKMAARLQRAAGRTLLYLDGAAGHGAGRGASHMARIQGMRLAFLMRELELPLLNV